MKRQNNISHMKEQEKSLREKKSKETKVRHWPDNKWSQGCSLNLREE